MIFPHTKECEQNQPASFAPALQTLHQAVTLVPLTLLTTHPQERQKTTAATVASVFLKKQRIRYHLQKHLALAENVTIRSAILQIK